MTLYAMLATGAADSALLGDRPARAARRDGPDNARRLQGDMALSPTPIQAASASTSAFTSAAAL